MKYKYDKNARHPVPVAIINQHIVICALIEKYGINYDKKRAENLVKEYNITLKNALKKCNETLSVLNYMRQEALKPIEEKESEAYTNYTNSRSKALKTSLNEYTRKK